MLPRARNLLFLDDLIGNYTDIVKAAHCEMRLSTLVCDICMLRCCCSQSLDHPRSLCDVDFARVTIPVRVDFNRRDAGFVRSRSCIYKLHFYIHARIYVYTNATLLNPRERVLGSK